MLHMILFSTEVCSNGAVRITGGPTSLEGVVELCVGTRWGTVCGTNWNNIGASVICHQLGHRNGRGHKNASTDRFSKVAGCSSINYY